jgi:hypothetical protein
MIDPNEADAQCKLGQAPAEIAVHRDANDESPRAKSKLCDDRANRQAIERGEDEGMIVRPG